MTMPEGHSIHRLAYTLTRLAGGRVTRASSPQGRFSAGAATIDGLVCRGAEAWGKHLFVRFASDTQAPIVHVHLGLYGSWTFVAARPDALPTHIGAPRVATEHLADKVHALDGTFDPPQPKPSVRLRLEWDAALADLTGPARCDLVSAPEVEATIARLGPDPLRPECDAAAFVDKVRTSARPIGALVMDQKVIAGPGNIYRAECLFRTGISPHRAGKNTSAARLERLSADLSRCMRQGVQDGQITTVEPDDAGKADDPEAARFYVYHRTGRECLAFG